MDFEVTTIRLSKKLDIEIEMETVMMEVGLVGWTDRALRVGMPRVVFILVLGHGFVPHSSN